MSSEQSTDDSYRQILETVAENPASSAEEISELAVVDGLDEGDSRQLLAKAVKSGDVLEADGKHWIVRKGEFGFHEFDHPA